MAVTNVTSFGRSGLSDWIVQRVSGVVLTVYLVVIAEIGRASCRERV